MNHDRPRVSAWHMMMIVIMMMKSCLTNEACFHEALNVTAYADMVSVFLGYECVPWPEWPSIVKDLQLASLSCGASRCQVRSIHDSHNFYILYFNFLSSFTVSRWWQLDVLVWLFCFTLRKHISNTSRKSIRVSGLYGHGQLCLEQRAGRLESIFGGWLA